MICLKNVVEEKSHVSFWPTTLYLGVIVSSATVLVKFLCVIGRNLQTPKKSCGWVVIVGILGGLWVSESVLIYEDEHGNTEFLLVALSISKPEQFHLHFVSSVKRVQETLPLRQEKRATTTTTKGIFSITPDLRNKHWPQGNSTSIRKGSHQ